MMDYIPWILATWTVWTMWLAGNKSMLAWPSGIASHIRKTHCPRGHPYDVVINARGWRRCRQCQRAAEARYLARRRV